jgi:hypothetical protein
MTRLALATSLIAGWVGLGHAEPPPVPNANVERWASGTIAYRVKSTSATTGHETWRLSVHPDGSRTMAATVQYAPRDIQRHVVHRVDAQWRALDTYVSTWVDGQWRGTALAIRHGERLTVSASTPTGPQTQALGVAEGIVMVPHVLAADSWRAAVVDPGRPDSQPIAAYNFNATGDGPSSVLGRAMDYRIAFVGREDVVVPAGRFASNRYRIEDAVDIYVSGPDLILVKFVYAAIDREHVLIEHTEGP